jgi:hypothetical protein
VCEAKIHYEVPDRPAYPAAYVADIVAPGTKIFITMCGHTTRCKNPATDHHHLTYARYGGDELPEDMLHACERCHNWLESQHPTRKR